MLFLPLIAFAAIFLQGAADNAEIKCYTDITGVFIRKYTDTLDGSYGLTMYLSRGGVLQMDSGEKQDVGAYYSDATGTYHCKKNRKSGVSTLTTKSFRYRERANNLTIDLLDYVVKCRGATDDCPDRVVTCKNGRSTRRGYVADIPNATTGEFEHPIPNTKITRPYKSLRLYKHATVTKAPRDRCYFTLSGLYVEKYDDGTYDVTAYGSDGTLFSINSGEQNPDGTYNSGSAIGEWYCTNQGSLSGRYNYFTYASTNDEQSLVDGTFSQQCSKDEFATCNGTAAEIPYPLQYLRPPFKNGRYDESSSSVSVSNQIFKAPTLKACHLKYAGSYAAIATLPRTGERIFSTSYLYRNGVVFVGQLSLVVLRSNNIGVWDCDSNGNVVVSTVEIRTVPTAEGSKLVFDLVIANTTCLGDGQACTGTSTSYATQGLELSEDGTFPSLALQAILPIISAKIKNAG